MPLVLWLLVTLASTVAHANLENPGGPLDSYIKGPAQLPRFERPLSILSTGHTLLAVGAFSWSMPVSIGSTRAGFAPRLGLHYVSNGSWSELGWRWQLAGVDRIQRVVRNGVPQYKGPAAPPSPSDAFVYSVAGESGELRFVSSEAGGLLYRPADEKSLFAKFYFDTSADTWTVLTRDGVRRVLGGSGATEQNPNIPYGQPSTFSWLIKTATHREGFVVTYSYALHLGLRYLTSIEYDRKDAGETYRPTINLEWEDRGAGDHVPSMRRGYRVTYNTRKLESITAVNYSETGASTQHVYAITQDPRGQVTAVQQPNTDTPPLPGSELVTTLVHSAGQTGLATVTQLPDPVPSGSGSTGVEQQAISVSSTLTLPGRSVTSTHATMIDVDGDGRLDQLFVPPGTSSWRWRRRTAAAWSIDYSVVLPGDCTDAELTPPHDCNPQAVTSVFSSPGMSSVRITTQTVRDVTGDGVADLLYVKTSETGVTWPYYAKLKLCPGSVDPTSKVLTFGSCRVLIDNATTLIDAEVCGSGWFYGPTTCRPYPQVAVTQGPYHQNGGSMSAVVQNLMDVNGDGRPELVAVSSSSEVKANVYWLDTESASPAAPVNSNQVDIPSCAAHNVGYSDMSGVGCLQRDIINPKQCGKRLLIDFNGDGIVDILDHEPAGGTYLSSCAQEQSGDVKVFLGTGKGFDVQNPIYVDLIGVPILRMVYDAPVNGPAYGVHQTSGFFDVDGDGRPDHVQWDENVPLSTPLTLTVRYNVGQSFGGATPFTIHDGGYGWQNTPDWGLSGTRVAGGYTWTRQALMDADGDGRVDLVIAQGNDGGTAADTPLRIYHNHYGEPAGYLLSVASPQGRTTSLAYDVAPSVASSMPYRVWAPTRIVSQDDATGDQTVRSIASHDAAYDATLRQFFGFYRVVVTEDAASGGTLHSTEHHFRQAATGTGQESWRQVRDGSGVPVREVTTTLGDHAVGANRWWVRPTKIEDKTIDQGEYTLTRLAEYVYFTDEISNQLGLLESVKHNGARETRYEYAYLNGGPADVYMVKRSRVTQHDAMTGQLLRESQRIYDISTQAVSWSCDGMGTYQKRGRLCKSIVTIYYPWWYAETSYSYDSLGRRIGVTDPDGVSKTFAYHSTSRPYRKEATNALGHQRTFDSYHPFSGQPGLVCGPEARGGVLGCTLTTRDNYGRPTAVDKDRAAGGDVRATSWQRNRVASFIYIDKPDPVSGGGGSLNPPRVISYKCPNQPAGSTSYGGCTRRISFVDSFGRVVASLRSGWPYVARYYAYENGRLATSWLPAQQSDDQYRPPPSSGSYTYTYDALDRLVGVAAPDGSQASLAYKGDELERTDPGGKVRTYTVNLFGETEKITDTVGGVPQTTQFAYDAVGRLAQITGPTGSTYTYSYRGDDKLAQSQLPTATFSYWYTTGGRLQQVDNGANNLEYTTYDALGRVATREGGRYCWYGWCWSAWTQQYTYDSDPTGNGLDASQRGHLTRVTDNLSFEVRMLNSTDGSVGEKRLKDLGSNKCVGYSRTRDALGQITQRSHEAGVCDVVPSVQWTIYNSFDAERLGSTYAIGSYDALLVHGYRPDGLPESVSTWMYNPSSGYTTGTRSISYDALDRPTAFSADINVTWNLGLQYDLSGNVSRLTDNVRGLDVTYSYDNRNRLTQAISAIGGPSYSYIYHPNGALHEVARSQSGSWRLTQFGYSNGKYERLQSASLYDSIYGSGNVTYDYDATLGARIGEAHTAPDGNDFNRDYVWTVDGRLSSVSHYSASANRIAEYNYDHRQKAWRRRVDNNGQVATTLLLDDEVEYDIDSGELRSHITAPGLRLVTSSNNAKQRLHIYDHTSVALVFKGDGTLESAPIYAPYGTLESPLATMPAFGYGQHRTVGSIGLSHMRARFYDPLSRQFLRIDPVMSTGRTKGVETFNPYAYADNNPITKVDPDGEAPESANFLFWLRAGQSMARARQFARAEAIGAGAGAAAAVGTLAIVKSAAAFFGTGAMVANAAREGVASYGRWVERASRVSQSAFARAIAPASRFLGAAARGTAGLEARAGQVHGALDSIAARQRTTAVLRTSGNDIVAGGARDLTPAQRALLGPGETAAKLPGAHAEVTALRAAEGAGVAPRAIGVTRPICPSCQQAIEASGGRLTSPTTAVWE